MFSFLKNHPFAVEAFFESSLVFTFAMPKEQIQHLIPECLELDTLNCKWAFIAVAMVETKALRPKGFPKILRCLAVRHLPTGKRQEGLRDHYHSLLLTNLPTRRS